jgi:hypothetical protein
VRPVAVATSSGPNTFLRIAKARSSRGRAETRSSWSRSSVPGLSMVLAVAGRPEFIFVDPQRALK